jgi:peptidoglycan-associated lipoprotein
MRVHARSSLLLAGLLAVVALGAGAGCPGPKYPTCDGDKDCKNGEKCVNKRCVQCAVDKDCPAGSQCVAGACQKKAGACETNADCPDGQACIDHQCSACTSDDQCGPGGKCEAGKCMKGTACAKDEDCPEDQDCKQGFCQKGTRVVTVGPKCNLQPVFFGFDQYSLNDEAKGLLQKDFECLQSESARKIAVVGFTDPRGTDEYNVALSDDRAQAVITYLGRLGVEPARMRKVPKGASEAKGKDEASWQQDRRCEFQWEQ